ncbi:unnamed protein product [Spirodela intermedia]|uniref:Uncharacterized protein n=1 Tax=Spirodela intermedia TaxID=51605 RepID=A0A7I8JHX4_SPIIN|nr:unnamed protein product [Spirodela intermedia]CAA6669754.1 unnamed protein product [Spirodela intermedia]
MKILRGLMLGRLSAFTVDDAGKETFVTGGALDRIQKSVELERLAFYLDSDICPWSIEKQWEDLLPSDWSQIFELAGNHSYSEKVAENHCYVLQPVTGNARYTKLRTEKSRNMGQPLQKAIINLEDVTLCLSERLKYAHYRPHAPISVDPRSWWKYAYTVVTDESEKASKIMERITTQQQCMQCSSIYSVITWNMYHPHTILIVGL